MDGQFIDRLREGDPEAEQLFASHFGWLLMLKLRAKVRSYDLLEDVRQETLMRALVAVRKGSVKEPRRLGAYISSIADHVFVEMLREGSRLEQEVPDSPDQRLDIDRELIGAEQIRQVRAVLSELPEKQRDILRLLFFHGLGRGEVCERLKIRPEVLRVSVHRACERLRKRICGNKIRKH